MKKITNFMVMFMVLQTFLFSCKCLKSSKVCDIVKTTQADHYPINNNWSDSLKNSGRQVKGALLNLFGNDINILNNLLHTSLTKDEINNLKVLSVETYKIDSADFKNLNEKSSIRLMLKLVKTQAECYLLKDLDIILNMEQITEKGQWRISNVGRTFDEVGNKIEDLYFKENIKVHDVIVDDYRYGKKKFIVFVRNGEYINIKYGKEVPFIQRLLEFRTNLESGKIF